MIISGHARGLRATVVSGVMVAGLSLAGCMASPTYGTDKTANQQLIEDFAGMLAFSRNKKPPIAYKPRPELVTPETTAVLPPPQDDVTAASNPAWPESPEQRLARIRAEATENSETVGYRPNVINDTADKTKVTFDDPILANMGSRERHEELRRRRAEVARGNSSQRQYLSEPPLDYRTPEASAPIGELGEPEWKKDRNNKRGPAVPTEADRPRSIFSQL